MSKLLNVWSSQHWGKWLQWKLNNRQLPPRWTLNSLVLRPHFVAHKIIVKVNNCSTSGSTGIRIYKITRIFTYKAIPSVDINHIFLPKLQFFLAVIVETEYRIPVIFAQSGQDTMSGHYPTNVTNYRPGRNNLTCKGGQLSLADTLKSASIIWSIVLMILTILLSTIFKVPSAEFQVIPNQSNTWVGSHTDLSSLTTKPPLCKSPLPGQEL